MNHVKLKRKISHDLVVHVEICLILYVLNKLKRKISHDLVVHVEICLILYVLNSRDGHFGNMQI